MVSEQYRQLFLDFAYATFLEDAAGIILDANAAAARLLDRPREEIVGRHHGEFLAPASLERLLPQRQHLQLGQRLQFDAQYLARDGRPANVILDICLIRWGAEPDQTAEVYLVVARECSKLDELERELRLQRKSAAADYATSRHATFFVSSRNEISPYPPRASDEPERLLDWVYALLLGPRIKPALDRAWAGEDVYLPPAWYSPQEAPGQTPDKTRPAAHAHWLKIGLAPMRVRGADVSDVCVHVLDCTAERLTQEEQRRMEQRVSSVLLTATLHYEMNNYLSVILAQASGLRLATSPGQLPPPHLGAIMDAAQNAANLLRQAADLGHQGGAELGEVEMNAIAADCAYLLPHLAHGRVGVVVELAPDAPCVRGDAWALRAMLLDLLQQAELRVPQGGRITLKTCRAKTAYPGVPHPLGITIQDNSPRLTSSAQIPAVGDAVDTLELALARAVLRAHRGQLEVVHAALQGRVFNVTLPGLEGRPHLTETQPLAAAAPVDEEAGTVKMARTAEGAGADESLAAGAQPVSPAAQARYKILLADDEENFRAFTSWVLKEHGYDVIIANDGQEAFERFQEAPESFHLVIVDAYMPRMGGLEAYLRMQVLRPDLPVLFASGFVRGASVDALLDGCPGPAGVLLKPFTSDDLLKAVQKALTPQP